MRLIGRIADGATETHARLILLKDQERTVTAEEIVLIENGGDKNPTNRIIGVLREGLGKNEFLSHAAYRPDVAYMKFGGEPSGAREVYSFSIKPIGVPTEAGVEPNRNIIQPRSPVYLLEESDMPLERLASGSDFLRLDAYLEGHPTWRIPANRVFIPYHVGVYGSTGSGKSWFTRHVLIPLYQKAGYRTLVLDWSGTDYAPYYPESEGVEVQRISEIALEEEAILSYFEEKTHDFGGNFNVRDGFDEFVESWREKVKAEVERHGHTAEAAGSLYGRLRSHVEANIAQISRQDYRNSAERAFRRVFRRLKPEDFQPIMGTVTVEELTERLRNQSLLIVDMGGAMLEAKIGFFLSLSGYLYRLMEAGHSLNLALVIDEAPQYAPWDPRGIQADSADMIKNLAALGRKRNLNLTLIAQGIKGEIGINASVRRNLNTHFFGRIHPLDAGGEGGASEWLSPYGISADHMLQLKPGRFYFTGVMNPSPVPLLITYDVPEAG